MSRVMILSRATCHLTDSSPVVMASTPRPAQLMLQSALRVDIFTLLTCQPITGQYSSDNQSRASIAHLHQAAVGLDPELPHHEALGHHDQRVAQVVVEEGADGAVRLQHLHTNGDII